MRGLLVAGVLAVFGLIFAAFDSFYVVEPSERGVVVTLGKVVDVAEPGANWKMPFLTRVHTFSMEDQVVQFPDMAVYTRDQQVATIPNVSINFVLPNDTELIRETYLRYGSLRNAVEQTLARRVSVELETVFGQFNAAVAVQERGRLNRSFTDAIRAIDTPFVISSTQIENFDLPDEYEASVNQQMQAEVEVRTREQLAEQAAMNARTTVINAQAEADAQLARATAAAQAVRIQGEAEADAIRARGEALRESPNLVSLVLAEQWDGVLPTTMLPNGALPFVDVTPADLSGTPHN